MIFFISFYFFNIYYLFGEVETISNLSQNTNYKVFQSSTNHVYISSADGLNIFDGNNVSSYRPSTHNMFGNNIQSDFYEDAKNIIWFCTYEALHAYNPVTDSLEYFFGTSQKGEVLQSDYRIIDFQDSILWFLADKSIFQFDLESRKIDRILPSYVNSVQEIRLLETRENYLFLAIANEGFYKFSVDKVTLSLKDTSFFEYAVQPMLIENDSIVYLGGLEGELIKFNHTKNVVVSKDKIASESITDLCKLDDSQIIVGSLGTTLLYDHTQMKVLNSQKFKQVTESLDGIVSVNLTLDSTLWIGNDGSGVHVYNQTKNKFQGFPRATVHLPSITQIYAVPNTSNLLITSRNGGIIVVNKSGEILQRSKLTNSKENSLTILSGTFISKERFFFIDNGRYFLYDVVNNTILESNYQEGESILWGIDFTVINDETTIFSNYSANLLSIRSEELLIKIDTVFTGKTDNDFLLSIKTLDNHNFFVSQNEESILVLKYESDTFSLRKTIPISGGVKSLCETESADSLFLSNSNGLYKIHQTDFGFRKVKHPTKAFSQTIYAIQKAKNDIYWLSSNQGLYSWNPVNDSLHQFSLADGIQALEYNTNAYYQDENGKMYFGGVKGLNAFDPLDISLMQHEAPVMLTEYMIGDTVSREFGMPHFVEDITLPYSRNTLSFRFHALDYSDLKSTRVKYKLSGVDRDYVIPQENIGFTRYPNLAPGNYELSLIGSNADKVWNKSERKVKITILPPIWETWWFRLLMVLTILGILALIFRSYYMTQLRKKDFLLKEQELIISKQQALQAERNRIASEMHDDLGGGLTTIKYLSQRVAKNIEDQKSRTQVEKIMSQSEELVNNMSEIIWAMNSGFDTMENLVAYIRRFSFEYLEIHGVELNFNVKMENPKANMTGDKRRNIFLVVKEIMHNAVKHAEATEISIEINASSDNLQLYIADDGKGLAENTDKNGNGLRNIKKRIASMNGAISHLSKEGLKYTISVPLGNE